MLKGAIKLSDTIWYVQGSNKGRYPFANSILVGGKAKLMVDTGIGAECLRNLAGETQISEVVFSHCHEDHTSGSHLLSNAKFYAHDLDVDAIESLDKLKERYLVKGTSLETVYDKFFFESLNLKGCRIQERIADNHVFTVGQTKLEVIHTPGHSAGHCCFYEQSSGVLFVSDIDLSTFGPWYGCADSDVDDFISSIRKLSSVKADIIVSSHKGVVDQDIPSRLQVFLEKIYERERSLLQFLRRKRTLDDIVNKAIIYGKFGEPREAYVLMEKVMIEKHLERLVRNGLAVNENDGYIAV